ncbi:MAG: carboxypeptidase regulatory-like domain-containing protein [Bacteroidota bacterium]
MLLLFVVCAGTAAAQPSYDLTVRGATLQDALAEVVRLTGIELVYPSDLAPEQRVFCAHRAGSVETLLQCILDGTGLDYVRSSTGAYVLIEAVVAEPLPGRLAGRVVDAETGEPLPFAHVLLTDASTATAADTDGLFAFADLRPGRYQVVATHVAYRASAPRPVWIEPGTAERLEIALDGRGAEAEPVVVDGLAQRLPSALLGLGAAEPAEATPYATASADVMAGARRVLGVSATPALADLHVQGGSPTEHVVRLDGVPVRDPVVLGRHLGAFSPLALGRMTVQKAGFGTAAGSQLTGAVDFAHRLGSDRSGAEVLLDPVGVNVRLSGPLGARGGQAMAAVRHSAWSAVEDPGVRRLLDAWGRADPVFTGLWLERPVSADALAPALYRPDVSFTDLHAAARFRPSPYATLHASAYYARNQVDADRTATLASTGEPDRLLAFRDAYDWLNGTGQVRYRHLVGARGVVGVQARAAHHDSGYAYRFGQAERSGTPGEDAALLGRIGDGRGGDAAHALTELALDADGTFSLEPGTDLTAGLGVEYARARFRAGHDFIAPLALDAAAWSLTGRLDGQATLGLRTVLEGGVRLTFLPARQTLYAEPRAAVRYDGAAPFGAYALRLAGGLYRQFVSGFAFRNPGPAAVAPEVLFWLPTTSEAPPRALHLAADALVMPGMRWTLRAEAFARWESRLLALDAPALQGPGPVRDVATAVAPASGRTLGAGLRLEYEGDRVRSSASYSAEHARRTVPGRYDGRRVATPWTVPHRLGLDADVRLGRGLGVRGSGQALLGRSWGYRGAYYDYLPAASGLVAEEFRDTLGAPEQDRLPAALRLDLGVYLARRVGPAWVRLDLGLLDALDGGDVYDWSRSTLGAGGVPVERGVPGRRWSAQLRVQF